MIGWDYINNNFVDYYNSKRYHEVLEIPDDFDLGNIGYKKSQNYGHLVFD